MDTIRVVKNIKAMAFRKQAVYIPTVEACSTEEKAYCNAYALNTFGIVFSNPSFASKNVIKALSEQIPINVPKSFYNNPQDLTHFSCAELLLEQLVSYFVIAISGTHNEETNFDRIELFNKALPVTSEKGDDIKLRTFTIVDDKTVLPILQEYADSYAAYLRPFGLDEMDEVITLCDIGVFDPTAIKCKDNIFNLLDKVSPFVVDKMVTLLDAKDVVKYSKRKYGEMKELSNKLLDDKNLELMLKNCKLIKEVSKKQAKGFNALAKLFNINRHVTAEENPERIAKGLLTEGKVVEAAKVFAQNGSLLNRNIKFLLSRATIGEAVEILDLVKTDSVTSLIQLSQTINNQDVETARTFTFIKNNKVKTHTETEYEATYRKTDLSKDKVASLTVAINDKIKAHYKTLSKLGKLYVSEAFKKVALPINTSASGVGLGVLPTGSRIKIQGDYIRTFCFWKGVFDIDASCAYQLASGDIDSYYWGNYSLKPRQLGESVLCSGDARGKDGAEYCDFKLSELAARGIRYLVYTLNGFGGDLNKGEIYCGYQDKGKLLAQYGEKAVNIHDIDKAVLETAVWDPKNIEFMVDVKGDSRFYIGFAIDTINREVIVLNLVRDSHERVLNKKEFNNITKYLTPDFLSINMYDVLAARATELVETPEEADIVFDADYVAVDDTQKVIRPSDVSALAKLATE